MPKYKFSLARNIKNYVEWELEHHTENKRALEEYKEDLIPSATSAVDATGPSGKNKDRTADAAVKLATSAYILNLERNSAAIDRVLSQLDEADRVLVSLVYWKRTHTMEGAAQAASVSASTAYFRANKIICGIAAEMGLINID